MTDSLRRRRPTWLNMLLGTALAGVLGLSFLQAMRQANLEADLRIARNEATNLHRAFQAYHERHGSYPNSYAAPSIDERTLDPLRRRGYYTGQIAGVLRNGRIDAYHSPDDQGLNQEFWLEMTQARDPSIRFLIARSDDSPLSGGEWREGVFIYHDGRLESVNR